MISGKEAPTVILVDNGSLRPASTLSLRRLAHALSARAGCPVFPISLLHSSTVSAASLNGVPAEILEPALQNFCRDGLRDFLLLPLFFGPSAALTEYVPERVRALRAKWPDIHVRLAAPLVNINDPHDRAVAALLCAQIRAINRDRRLFCPRVVVVDHGSPQRAVTAVRNHVTDQVRSMLADEVSTVAAASMERREGPAYAFNEPLLTSLLCTPPFNHGDVVVSLLFISPGRHAGPDGDIATICRQAEESQPGLRTWMTGLAGGHPALVELLAQRLAQAEAGAATVLS